MPEDQAQQLISSLSSFLKGWQLHEQGKRLKKYYYIEDYPKAYDFLGELIALDSHEFKQCPSFRKQCFTHRRHQRIDLRA